MTLLNVAIKKILNTISQYHSNIPNEILSANFFKYFGSHYLENQES